MKLFKPLPTSTVALGIVLSVVLAGVAFAATSGNPFIGSNGAIIGCVPSKGGNPMLVKAGKDLPEGHRNGSVQRGRPTGPSGTGPAYSAVRPAGPLGVHSVGTFGNPTFTTVATLSNLPAGSYEFLGQIQPQRRRR